MKGGRTARSLVAVALTTLAVAACNGGDGGGDGGGDDGGGDAGGETTTTTTTTTTTAAGPGRETLAPLPLERTEVSGARWDGQIVVLGGLTADAAASARVDTYGAEADEWQRQPDLPVPLHHAAIAVAGERLFVIGGYSNGPGEEWQLRDGVYVLVPGADEWRSAVSLPEGRGALAAVTIGDRIYAVGGVTAAGVTTRVESLATDGTGRWQREPDLTVAREHLAVAVGDDGRIYAVAGRAPGNLDAVESWAPGEDSWQRDEPVAHARSGIAAATVGGQVCVAGGEGPEGTIAPVECLRDGAWRVVAELATPRHGLAVVEHDGRLHVISGGPEPGLTVSGVHEVFDLRP